MTTGNVTIKQVLLKRGTTAQNLTYTGPVGELTIDTTLDTVRVHDGSTPGGINILATNNQVAALSNAVSTLTGIDATFMSNVNALLSNAATQGAQISLIDANVNALTSGLTAANARINTISTSFGNANVAGYLAHYDQSINFIGFPATISGLANIYSTNYFYPNGQSIFTSITANAANQAADILTLYSNAAVQSAIINNMTANAGAYQAYANTQIISLTGNAGSQGSTLASLLANVGAFETYANTTFATGGGSSYGNSNVAGYLPLSGTIIGINANVTAANAAIQTLGANVGAYHTWANTNFGTSSYSNTNVAAYLVANPPVGTYSNTNVAAYLTAGTSLIPGVTLAGNAFLGPISGSAGVPGFRRLTTTDLPDLSGNISSYLSSNTATTISTTGNITTIANIVSPNYLFANGVNILSTIAPSSTYSNTNVAAYLTTQTFYSNANVQSYIGANVGAYQTWANATFGGASTYSNVQTAAFLKSYSGNLSSGDFASHGNTVVDYRLTVLGDVSGLSTIIAGLPGYTVLPYTMAQFSSTANSYTQFNIQNTSTGTQATTDYVATASNGTDSTYYVDLGISGPTYNGATPTNNLGTAVYPNDAYVYTEGDLSTSAGGNLVIGAVTATKNIKFVAGGHDLANVAVTINNPGTQAIDNQSGTMVVNGGLAASGNINFGSFATSLHSIRGNLLLGGGNQASADSLLTINTANATPIVSNATVHISGDTNQNIIIGIDSFGNSASVLGLRHARGGPTGPIALGKDDLIGAVTAKGWGGNSFANINSFSNTTFANSTSLAFYAAESYTNSAQGTYIVLRTASNGANVATTTMRVDSTNVTIPNANVIASNYLFANGVNILSTVGAGTYGDANVAAYLPTYSGNIQASVLRVSSLVGATASSPAPVISGFSSIATTGSAVNEGNITASGNLVASRGAFVTGNVNAGNIITTNAILGNTTSRSNLNTILLINQASTTPLNTPNAVVHIHGGQDRSINIVSDAIGTNAATNIIGRKASGTTSLPTAAGIGDCLIAVMGQGHSGNSAVNSSGYLSPNVSTVSGFSLHARENFTETAQGTRADIRTTPIGSNVAVVAVLVENNSNVVLTSATTSTSTTTGALVVAGGTGVAGNLTVGGNIVQQSAYYETYGNISNTGGNLTCNFNLGTTFYAALTANVTANFTNVNAVTSTVSGATIVVDQGATAYRVANVQVNGVNQTVRWVGASTGVGTASNTDVMSFSLINLGGGAYRVLGQISNYG